MYLEKEFEEIVRRMDETCHGSESWKAAARFFQERFKKSLPRLEFLESRMLQAPIYWKDCCETIWPGDVPQQNANKFSFLQGDVLVTSLVGSWISHDGAQLSLFGAERAEHSHWLVLSPDCDVVRSDFVRVAPIFEMDKVKDQLALALAFKSAHLFPLPKIDGDAGNIVGRYADLSRMFLLDCRGDLRDLPTPVASLTEVGWHMLNAQLIQQISRSEEKAQAIALRNFSAP